MLAADTAQFYLLRVLNKYNFYIHSLLNIKNTQICHVSSGVLASEAGSVTLR